MVSECVSGLFDDNKILMQIASKCKFTESPEAESEDNRFFGTMISFMRLIN